ncbi:uncharacterized protein LOC103570221 isoform X2 [Microplitis demolitor]|uniref:uncharacterized protein LOC103570221 isoform X2 n=1 Tax=Microplitis demolitor TaxID=69319 RepID=UPI00043FFFCF|nr:uncharacterized protein LOC103570221 isoform X2 [Microplitis demolitor]
MAHEPVSNFVLKNNSALNHVDIKPNILQKIQPLKRIFNQPNIVITLMPTDSSDVSSENCKNSENVENIEKNEEANFLPSKKFGNSEITLLPIKREQKSCGHYEPCENITCDVNVQQYVDHQGSSPMLATSIDDSEINAKVSKHCDNARCDALSIEHNRCRRAIICLYRCDKSSVCDICGVLLKTRKSRLHHGNCKRKNEYRHNQVDGAQILRERMRERELQIMEAVRARKNDYSDPITGPNKAIETLKNNSELIVIPKKMAPIHQSTMNQQINTNLIANHFINETPQTFDDFPPNIPVISIQKPHLQKSTSNKQSDADDTSDTLNQSKVGTNDAGNNQYIITTISQPNVSQSFTINDWVMGQPKITSETQLQNPYFVPVRVIPITKLKSEPSLLHQTQGIPKFCIIADNTSTSRSLFNGSAITSVDSPLDPKSKLLQKSLSLKSTPLITIKPKITDDTLLNNSLKTFHNDLILSRRRKIEQKPFECQYCSKRFLTDWYFKLHISKHKGELKVKCSTCDEAFTNNNDLKKHISNEHKDTVETCKNSDSDIEKDKEDEQTIACDDCEQEFDSNIELEKHECGNFEEIVCTETNLDINSEN